MRLSNVAKILIGILSIEFIMVLFLWGGTMFGILQGMSTYLYLLVPLVLVSCMGTIVGLYQLWGYQKKAMLESMKHLDELNLRLRAQRHDYLNQLQVVYGLLEMEEYEEAKGYLTPVFKDIMKVSKALKTVHPAVNALLQAKMEAAEKQEIDFYLEIRTDLAGISIPPWELCKILANIIDNSIQALQKNQGERKLNVEIYEDMEAFYFDISNNGPEISAEVRQQMFKPGFTTKSEEGHGMGLSIVANILREYDGEIKVKSAKERTGFTVILPKQPVI